MEDARLRWAVDVHRWEPEGGADGDEFAFLLSIIPAEEAEKVRKFVFLDDKKRALVSRLLQRRCCERVTGLPWGEVRVARTKGQKPFLANRPAGCPHPNFNFNVSHEGDFVVLASEPVCVCGVDVAAPGQLRMKRGQGAPRTVEEMLQTFSRQLTEYERGLIKRQPTDDLKEEVFRRHWSMKEAFVKGRGDGLGFELGRCEFRPRDEADPKCPTADVVVDGQMNFEWAFKLQPIGAQQEFGSHWITVSRGPPKDVVDAHGEFTSTLSKTQFTSDEWQAELDAPAPAFQLITVSDLVPDHLKDDFEAAGGDVW